MAKYKSVKEMKKHLYKRTLLDEIKYYLYYAPLQYLDMLPRRIYWFFQRGFRGYGDNDTWDFGHYLATIIIGGLKQFKKYYHGSKPTKKELNIIIKGFEANLKMMNDPRKYKKLLPTFHKGMDLFKKYFNYFWD